MSKKKTASTPIIIVSREGAQSVVSEIVKLRLEQAQLVTAREQEVAAIQTRYQKQLDELAQHIQARESGTYLWCKTNKAEFGARKSIEFNCATVGFRTTPPRVEKLLSREPWGAIARRLEALDWGRAFLSVKEPEVNKEAILGQRTTLTPEQLTQAGLRIEQDEIFYIDPKSEVLEATVTREAA